MSALTDAAQELYSLPLEQFTAARNARAKQLRPADRDAAAVVARLPKPTTAAWVVNMMAAHLTDELGQLLALGASLREAQDSLDRDSLRALTRQRRQLVAALARQGGEVAASLGYEPTPAVLGEVEQTLHAALTDADAGDAVLTGRLLRSLDTEGLAVDLEGAVAELDEAASASPRKPAERKAVRDDLEARRREKAEREREEARRDLEEAEARSDAAASKLDDIEDRLDAASVRRDDARDELDELRERLEKLERELTKLGPELERLERERDEASTAAQAARRDARRARQRADALGD
jgi:hypothetical protein